MNVSKFMRVTLLLFLLVQIGNCDNISKADYDKLKEENQNLNNTITDLQKKVSTLNECNTPNADCPKNLKITVSLPESISGVKYKVKFKIENSDDSLYYHVLQKNSNEPDSKWHLQKSGKSVKDGFSDIEFGNKTQGIGETFDVKVFVSKKLIKRIQGDQTISYEEFKDDICKEVDKSTTRSN